MFHQSIQRYVSFLWPRWISCEASIKDSCPSTTDVMLQSGLDCFIDDEMTANWGSSSGVRILINFGCGLEFGFSVGFDLCAECDNFGK